MSEYVQQQVGYLNSIFEKSLDENSPQAKQPNLIKTQLFPHQKACLYEMISRVKKPKFVWNNQTVFSKIGILGDQHNSGKTLTALAFLAHDIEAPIIPQTNELHGNSNAYFFSIQSYQENIELNRSMPINVILAPSHLIYQWKITIETHTNLNVFTIDTKTNLSGIKEIPHNSIFLVNSRLFKYFNTFSIGRNLHYKYFIIDEATFIYLSVNDPHIDAGYIWLITAEWIPLMVKQLININLQQLISTESSVNTEFMEILENYKISYQIYEINNTYIKNYIPFHHDGRYSMIIRSANRFINQSLPKRPEIIKTIHCRPHFNIHSLFSFFSLQGNIDKLSSFLPYIYHDLNIQSYTHNEILEYEFFGNMNLYLSRFNDDCSICLENPRQKILTPCCRRIYCATCIFKNYFQKLKCPTCRSELNICNIKVIDPDFSSLNNSLKYRDDSLLNYLQDNSGNRTIVYSAHQNIYYNIKEKLDQSGINSECLEYSASSNLKKIKNFQDKKYTVLFISDVLLLNLYGLNFGFIDCLIFINNIPYFDLKNILLNSAGKGHTLQTSSKPLQIVEMRNIHD